MKILRILPAVCFLWVLANQAIASEPTERVRALLSEVISIQSDPALAGEGARATRATAIKEVIGRSFDFDRMSERALGEYWNRLGPEERVEFHRVFKELFQDSYAFMVLENIKDEKIRYTDEDVREQTATVKTVMYRSHENMPIEYELGKTNGKWLIRDVKISGVSILQNYQVSFASVIKRESYDTLIKKMRLKKEEIEKSS